jgi:hypothetical protein
VDENIAQGDTLQTVQQTYEGEMFGIFHQNKTLYAPVRGARIPAFFRMVVE